MSRVIMIVLLLFITVGTGAVPKHKTVRKITRAASFPGGTEKLMHFLHDNIKYPLEAKEGGIEGRVIVRFVINEAGGIEQVHLLRGIAPSCDNEALRVIRSMPPWSPAMYKGRKIKSVYVLPVTFRLE
ncbi:energy transducer TonB [Chitinophagaceae bacterium MMS25-I14]